MNKICKTGIRIMIGMLGGVYAVMKKLPQQERVVMLSRQDNVPSLDIELLSNELRLRGIDVKILCNRMDSGIVGAVRYIAPLFEQMHYLATSKVAVLDSYCIPACLFKKRNGQVVIQMWHALGAMKKFGKSILDKPEGRPSDVANLLKMHEGYDYIFTSSEKARPAFAEAFGYPPEKLTIMSLPRVDAITDKEADERNAKLIVEDYPQLKEKRNILYAPTLRRTDEDMNDAVSKLIDAVDKTEYNLIVKMHPLTVLSLSADSMREIIVDTKYSTTEMMTIADYMITDYSAVTFDAALKGIPIYFYAFDKESYFINREFYLDYDKDMPGPICSTAEEVVKEIKRGDIREYRKKVSDFVELYIEKTKGCTSEIADMIEELLK